MSQRELLLIVGPLALGLATLVGFLIYAAVRYAPIIGRIFEEKPLFLPLRLPAEAGGEEVQFPTEDGLQLRGTLFRTASGATRVGMLVFCHEYLSDRWSFHPYTDRHAGNRVRRLHVRLPEPRRQRQRTELPPAPVGDRPRGPRPEGRIELPAVAVPTMIGRASASSGSVGGAERPWSSRPATPTFGDVITDGAFPTRGTMLAYILRWAEIYVSNPWFWKIMPLWVFRYVAWAGRVRSSGG